MQLEYSVDMDGWTRAMSGVQRRARDLTPVHEQIGDMLIDEVRDNFETSGGAEAWADLAPATLTPLRRLYGTRPLIKTRALLKSITKDARDAWVDVGSSMKQARRLFFGWDGSGPRTPARSPFKFRDGVMDSIANMYLRFLYGGLFN